MSLRIVLSVVVLAATSLTSLDAFSQAAGIRRVPNGFHRATDRIPELSVAEISASRADELFAAFAGRKDIPWDFPGGASTRASAMTAMAEERGIQMIRVFVEGDLSTHLRSTAYPYVRGFWNAAPAAYVIGPPPEFKSQLMVFDPSVASRPITQAEWTELNLKADPRRNDSYEPNLASASADNPVAPVYYGSRFQKVPFEQDVNRTAGSPDDPDDVTKGLARLREFLADPNVIPDDGLVPDALGIPQHSRPGIYNQPPTRSQPPARTGRSGT